MTNKQKIAMVGRTHRLNLSILYDS